MKMRMAITHAKVAFIMQGCYGWLPDVAMWFLRYSELFLASCAAVACMSQVAPVIKAQISMRICSLHVQVYGTFGPFCHLPAEHLKTDCLKD